MSLILSGTDGLSDVDGSAATPAIRGTDANTGIFFGADIIGFAEGGAEVARFNADAQFVAAAGTASLPVITTTGDVNTGIFFPAADTIAFSEGGAEAMRIDSSGYILAGYSSVFDTSPAGTGQYAGISSSTSSASNWKFGALSFSADATANGMLFVKSRSATVGTNTVVQSGDALGNIIWRGADGTNYINAASIQAFVDGTPGTNDMPGRLTVNTTADGAASQTERMRIDSSGNVGIGASSPGNRLLVSKNDNTYYLTDFNNTFTSGNGYINRMLFGGSAPNNTSSIFSAMVDNAANRCIIYANGGIHNYQANNSNLSDRREKTNFAPAGEYLSKICAIPVQTFNYIDQNLEEDAGLTLGVIAQDVQAVAPELVSESDWSPEKDGSKMRLSIYQTDLQYALMKCIQEQQALITALTARIEALEAQNANNPPQGETP